MAPKGKGTSMACSYLNDVIMYCNGNETPHSYIYVVSMLKSVLTESGIMGYFINCMINSLWLTGFFLLIWYKDSSAVVKWNNCCRDEFSITRGTTQGSILSPLSFNYFINDLLLDLKDCNTVVRIGSHSHNSFACWR